MSARAFDPRVLHRIVSTVASSLDLAQVLNAVVSLLSEGSGVRACFVYLMEKEPDRLVLRAASPPYQGSVGSVVLERGEGLAWWAANRREAAFIRDHALDDPRTKYVPELEEERFQSLLAVPVLARSGAAIGVITAHTEAPREFTDEEVEFLVSSASLVGGAIENARLFAETRARVVELERLTRLAEAIARAGGLDELLGAVAKDGCALLGAASCHVYLPDPAAGALILRASFPDGAGQSGRVALNELGPEISRRGGTPRLSIPLIAGDEMVGLLVAERSFRADIARALASQAAVGIEKVRLIEGLTERNLIKDFFDHLAGGRKLGDLAAHSERLGIDLLEAYVVIDSEPPNAGLEVALNGLESGALLDRGEESLRALARVPATGLESLVARLRAIGAQLERPVAIGVSSICVGEEAYADGFVEAREALLGSSVLRREPGVVVYEELGAYKYLLKIALEGGVRDATAEAVSRLAAYDASRSASLVQTLEELLRRRGSVRATADALYIHPNTLRQRVRRIRDVSGLDLRRDDWLMIELAVRMVKLQRALEGRRTSP